MSSFSAPALPSPSSETGSLVFEDGISSDGVSSPDEPGLHLPLAPLLPGLLFDGAKGVTTAGLDLHSPTSAFVGTPFTSGPAPLFEYPFPATPAIRPSLSNPSSLSSVHRPPSPSTRLKHHPFARLSSKSTFHQPARRRYSGGNNPPPIRVPPRLRTDSSSSSVASSAIDEPILTAVSAAGPSSSSPPLRPCSLAQRRDRPGSLGVLPLVTSVQSSGRPNDAGKLLVSPPFVASAAVPVRSALRRTISERDDSENEERPSLEWRRGSVPAIFGSCDAESDEPLDTLKTPISYESRTQKTASNVEEVTLRRLHL